MKKLISLTIALVLIVTCLSGICFAADPIATIVTGSKTKDVTSVEELVNNIDPSGNSVITLKQDITYTEGPVQLAYSCTVDFNGHTITTSLEGGNGVEIMNIGKENDITTLKNGKVMAHTSGLRLAYGGAVLDNMVIECVDGAPVAVHELGEYTHVIKNSKLSSGNWGCISWNLKALDFSAVKIHIEESTLISYKNVDGSFSGIQVRQSNAIPGTVDIGKGVEMYSFYNSYVESPYKPDLFPSTGEALTMAEGTHSVEVMGKKVEGLNKWTSPVAAPVVPETPAQPATPVVPETPAAPVVPETPAAPSVPTTNIPDVTVPKTGVSVMALGLMAVVSLAGAVVSKKR